MDLDGWLLSQRNQWFDAARTTVTLIGIIGLGGAAFLAYRKQLSTEAAKRHWRALAAEVCTSTIADGEMLRMATGGSSTDRVRFGRVKVPGGLGRNSKGVTATSPTRWNRKGEAPPRASLLAVAR